MIVFDLSCPLGHRFEGWFGSSEDFLRQCDDGLVVCPNCGSPEVIKAPMAPAVPKKGNQRPAVTREKTGDAPLMAPAQLPPQVAAALRKVAEFQAEAIKQSEWVGDRFAEESRAIHYGERDGKSIHGKASAEEAQELVEEGIAIAPLLIPIAPPDEIN